MAGALCTLAIKLGELLKAEYNLQKDVKDKVEWLKKEVEAMHVDLCVVANEPYYQLNPQDKLWARNAHEVFYDMEDNLEKFLVKVHGSNQTTNGAERRVDRFIEKVKQLRFSEMRARHNFANRTKKMEKQLDDITKWRDRNKNVVNPSTTSTRDPRLFHLLEASELVDIDEQKDELIKILTLGDDAASYKKRKIVSILGPGGLGKTTLAKVVYEKLIVDMNNCCKAFVSVGRSPDLKKVFRDILFGLNKEKYMNIQNLTKFSEIQLMEEIQSCLKENRYFIVIDDVWDVVSWRDIIKAIGDNKFGSKIMVTTRSRGVANELVDHTYEMKKLRRASSKILFNHQIFGSQDGCPEELSQLSEKILDKCDGVPLAIITIARLLASKSDDKTEWQRVYSSIGSGLCNSNDMYEDMRRILSLSYHDLPPDIKPCFLYLSMYPEDHTIHRDHLIWRWISEGFISPQQKGDDLFELGKFNFNILINRSLLQPVGNMDGHEIYTCRVHDMILDLICFLSREENFVTTSDDLKLITSLESRKPRRLSLKTNTWPNQHVSKVRSISFFIPHFDSMPSFSRLKMLRVLDLEGCSLKDCGGSMLSVKKLIHLRYLGLRKTGLHVLPSGIEKLKFLQVLHIDDGVELSDSIFKLKGLMFLLGSLYPPSGKLLCELVSLQVLHTLYLDLRRADTVEALGNLTQLTEVSIYTDSEMEDQKIFHNLSKLPRLQYLWITSWSSQVHVIDTLALPQLSYLDMDVHTVGPKDIQNLGTLQNLLVLNLTGKRWNYEQQLLEKFVVRADAFPRLRHCKFTHVSAVPSMIKQGAMPRVEYIHFSLRTKDFFFNPDGLKFDALAIDHLPSLKKVAFSIFDEGKPDEVKKLEEAVRNAWAMHPNRPKLIL